MHYSALKVKVLNWYLGWTAWNLLDQPNSEPGC